MMMPPPDPQLLAASAAIADALPDTPEAVVEKLNAVLSVADAQGQLARIRSQGVGSVSMQIADTYFIFKVPAANEAGRPSWLVAPAHEAMATECGFRIDRVERIKDLLAGRASPPALLARRRIGLRGSMGALQRFGAAFEKMDHLKVLQALPPELLGDSAALSRVTDAVARIGEEDEVADCWIPDEAVTGCGSCGRDFPMLRRRHHCRKCGGIFCAACAPKPAALCVVLQLGRSRPNQRRTCQGCRDGRSSTMSSMVMSSTASLQNSRNGAMSSMSTGVSSQSLRRRHAQEDSVPFADSSVVRELSGVPEASLANEHASTEHAADFKRLEEELKIMREVQLHELMSAWFANSVVVFIAIALSPLLMMGPSLALDCTRIAMFNVGSSLCSIAFLLYLWLVGESLIRRRLRIFWMAFLVWMRFKKTRIRCRNMQRYSQQYDLLWDETHRIVAFFIHLHFKELRGFWVKLGQYASTRADILPEPYVEWLTKLQDQMPSAPIEDIREIVQSQLGKEVASTLTIEPSCLASASIAQVHKAAVKGSSVPVVVKVQHDGIDVIMTQDIRSLEIVLSIIAFMEPDFDLRPLIEEWKKASREELDFNNEAWSQTRARDALISAGMDKKVLIPEVWPTYTRRRVMVMDFVDGVKITDAPKEFPGLNQQELLRAVVDAFAFQLHVDGHFNGDPHPGNLLVERSTRRPVMLDWGLCKTFTEDKKVAFAKMVYAVDAQDIWTMMESFEEMGFKFKGEDGGHLEPGTALEVMRFVLRDSATGDTKELMRKRGEADEKKFLNDRKLKRKDPVEAFSGEVLFFFRTVDCLQGLCAGLGVQLPFLSMLAVQAQAALLRTKGASPSLSPHAFLPSGSSSQTCSGPLQEQLSKLLTEFYRNGQLCGAQVSVVAGGSGAAPSMLADAAAGVLGPLDPHPVDSSTLFVAHGLSQLPLAAALLTLVESGKLSLNERLCNRWKNFEANGKDGVTVADVLARSAGLWHVFPKGLKLSKLLDMDAMIKYTESAVPWETPGSAQVHHYWSFGWLAAGLCQHLAGCELGACWADMCQSLLQDKSLHDELLLRGPEQSQRSVAKVQKPPSEGVEVAELMTAIARMEMETSSSPDDPAWQFFQTILTAEHLLDPQLYNLPEAKRATSLCGQGVHASARALASLVERMASRPTTSTGRALLDACAASKSAEKHALKPSPLADPLRNAPAPLPGIIRDLFEEADASGAGGNSPADDAFWHSSGFQSLPAMTRDRAGGAAGVVAPESGAFAAWLPDGNSSSSGVAVCLLANRLDIEASGLSEAVAKLVTTYRPNGP